MALFNNYSYTHLADCSHQIKYFLDDYRTHKSQQCQCCCVIRVQWEMALMTVPSQRSMTGRFISGDNERGPKRSWQKRKTKNVNANARKVKCLPQAFPSRMSKKRRIDLVKSHLPETPEKKVDVLAAIIESPTTRNGLENKGIIPSAVSEEAQVAVAVMSDARDAINAIKDQRSDDSRAATQTALGFLCGGKVKTKRMKTKV